ncbi:hypothetical protein ACTA71_008799 [Dictyostelium dimigraforme]
MEKSNLKLNGLINIISYENDKRIISKYPILKLYLFNEDDIKYDYDSNKILWFVCLESGNIFQDNLKTMIDKIDYYGDSIARSECICSMCELETNRIAFQHFKILQSFIPIPFQNSLHYVNQYNDTEYKLIKLIPTIINNNNNNNNNNNDNNNNNNNINIINNDNKKFISVNCFFNQSKCPHFSFFGCHGDTVFQFNSGYSNAHFDVVDHNKTFNSGIFKSKKPYQILYETFLKDYEICQHSNLVVFWSVRNSIEFYHFPKGTKFQINLMWKKFGDKIYIIPN